MELKWPLEVTLKKKRVKNLNLMLFPKKRDVVLEKMINNVETFSWVMGLFNLLSPLGNTNML